MTTKIYEIKGGRNFLPRSTNLPSEIRVNQENGDYTIWLNQDITANGHSCWVIIGRQTEEKCRDMLLDILRQPDVHGYEEVELSDLINLILVDANDHSKFNTIMDDLHTYDIDALDLDKVLEDYKLMSDACGKHDIEPKDLEFNLTAAQEAADALEKHCTAPEDLDYLLDLCDIVCNHKQYWFDDEPTLGEEEEMLGDILRLGWLVKDFIHSAPDDWDDELVALLEGLKALCISNANDLQTWAIEQAGIDPYSGTPLAADK